MAKKERIYYRDKDGNCTKSSADIYEVHEFTCCESMYELDTMLKRRERQAKRDYNDDRTYHLSKNSDI